MQRLTLQKQPPSGMQKKEKKEEETSAWKRVNTKTERQSDASWRGVLLAQQEEEVLHRWETNI